MTLLFLVLINLFAVAFWKIVPAEMHSAKRSMLETQAYFASDAGVIDSLAFLEDITADGNVEAYFNSHGVINEDGHLVLKRSAEFNGWTWECEIIPGPGTFGHNGATDLNPLAHYQIKAAATRPNSLTERKEQYRVVSAWVKQRSYVDKNWNNLAVGGQELWLFMDSFTLDGDYHTNGPGLLQIENANFWDNEDPAIGGEFTFAQFTNANIGRVDGVKYSNWGANTVPYWTTGSNRGQPRGDRYDKISVLGRAGIRETRAIAMPVNNDKVAFGVWGKEPPTTNLTDDKFIFGSDSVVEIAINNPDTDEPLKPGQSARTGIWIDRSVAQIEYETVNAAGNTSARATSNNTTLQNVENDNQLIRIYQTDNANRYVEIIHVRDQPYTIPGTGTILEGESGPTYTNNQTLNPTDNGGRGYTVIKNVRSRTNPGQTQYAIFPDQTNGAIFVDGDVAGLRGVVKGQRTVGVPTDNGTSTANDREIHINGEILYAGTARGDYPDRDNGTIFGLIGYAVRMVGNPDNGAPTATDVGFNQVWPTRNNSSLANPHYLYCSIFAGRRNDPALGWSGNNPTLFGGGFGSLSPDNSGWRQGHMVLFGSITEGIRQWKGTGNTGGNSYAFRWDRNLDLMQPPYFPVLPTYDVLTWEEKTVFSY